MKGILSANKKLIPNLHPAGPLRRGKPATPFLNPLLQGVKLFALPVLGAGDVSV
jgi:hypothetical protein